jgi:hypothetical protein
MYPYAAPRCPTYRQNSHANHTWHSPSRQTACFLVPEAPSPWVRFPSPAPLSGWRSGCQSRCRKAAVHLCRSSSMMRVNGVPARVCAPENMASTIFTPRLTRRRRKLGQLCALWWATQDHRQHRGAAAHCEDPVAPGAHGAGAVPERAGGWGAGAAGAVLPAVNWTMSSDPDGR